MLKFNVDNHMNIFLRSNLLSISVIIFLFLHLAHLESTVRTNPDSSCEFLGGIGSFRRTRALSLLPCLSGIRNLSSPHKCGILCIIRINHRCLLLLEAPTDIYFAE